MQLDESISFTNHDCQSCVSIEPEIVVSLQLVNRCALGSNFSCNLCQKHHHMLCSRTALMRQCRTKGHHNKILTVPIADRAFLGSCKAPCQAGCAGAADVRNTALARPQMSSSTTTPLRAPQLSSQHLATCIWWPGSWLLHLQFPGRHR